MFTTKTKNKPESSASWEQFCKDEARRAAHIFLEKVRRLQTEDRSSMEVPETVFATKFSAHFMDEVLDLTGGGVPNGGILSQGDRRKSGAGKSWWNIFKRRQSREDRSVIISGAANKNALSNRGLSFSHGTSTAIAVLEAHVKMLDMSHSSMELSLSWQACRLVLTSEQGNHQLEIYNPPKVSLSSQGRKCVVCVCVCVNVTETERVCVGSVPHCWGHTHTPSPFYAASSYTLYMHLTTLFTPVLSFWSPPHIVSLHVTPRHSLCSYHSNTRGLRSHTYIIRILVIKYGVCTSV